MSSSVRLGIAIIGNIFTKGTNEVFLKKLVCLLEQIAQPQLIFTIWESSPKKEQMSVISPHPFRSVFGPPWRNLLTCIFGNLIMQLSICCHLLKKARKIRWLFVINHSAILPAVIGNLLSIRVMPFYAGNFHFNRQDESSFLIFLDNFYQVIFRMMSNLADKLIVESKGVVEALVLKNHTSKIHFGPTYVDCRKFRILTKPSERKLVIGYVGNLSPTKGVREFIISLSPIVKEIPDVQAIVIGDGPIRSNLENLVEKEGIANSVAFLGWQSHDSIPDHLNRMKLLVLPSQSEGLPNIILESMACGTPVLAAAVGGIPDVIHNSETGYILSETNPSAISSGICNAIKKHDLDKIAVRARKQIEEKYCFEAAKNRYQKILFSR